LHVKDESLYTTTMKKLLPRSFYARDTVVVAKDLLGKMLVREYKGKKLIGIITETEAYRYDDPACHACRGKTPRTEALFGQVGHAYIYFSYGIHYCMNIVSRDPETTPAGGVLIRAIKPVAGIEIMEKNRSMQSLKHLTNGPGKVTQALAIDMNEYGMDVTKVGPLYVTQGIEINSKQIHVTERIGISKAKELKWRFVLSI